MSQWDNKIYQPMPGPFLFPNSRKGPGIEVAHGHERCRGTPASHRKGNQLIRTS